MDERNIALRQKKGKMELSEAIRHILDGNAVLFAGSGLSAGAIKEDGETFATATPLSHQLLSACGYDVDVDDLGLASEVYLEEKGESNLLDFLRKEYTAVDITKEQEVVGSLPWKRIYTTNYDNVLDLAYQRNKKRLDSAVLSSRPTDYQDKKSLCVHLNGKLSLLTGESLNDQIKLTNTSYLTQSFQNSSWIKFFQTDLQSAKVVFFIGYSMRYDLDIQRLVFAADDLKNKTFFILRDGESAITQQLIKRFGTPLAIGLKGLTEEITSIKKTYIPQPQSLQPYLCFKKFEADYTQPNILDSEVFDFYFYGNYGHERNIFYSLQSPTNYPFCVYRTKIHQVLESIKAGQHNILIHSALGNGKTVFLIELATLLAHDGYNVYSCLKYRTTINDEIERICKEKVRTAIIFDKYADCRDYLETFKHFRTDQLLIVAERTSLNDIQYEGLSSDFGEFECFDLNRLDDDEISQLVSLFNHYGLWSAYASLRTDKKFNIIASECRRSMCRFVLKMLNSENIIKKFSSTISGLRSKAQFYDAIIFILISKVAGFELDMDDLINALDATQLNTPTFRNNPMVKEFIDFEGSKVRPMSSIVADVLLKKIFNTDVVVDVMIRIFKQLNEIRGQKEVSSILRKMMVFSNLQTFLNSKDKNYKYNLISFYEAIRPLGACAENPYFWLQYAILKLSVYDYNTANIYFNNAYSYAKNIPGFDTYQIDNHHARFLLENEIEFGSQASCMQAFSSAHEILTDPKHRDVAYYYPYRVSQKYFPFYEKYYNGMNNSEKKVFVNSCEAMLERTEWYLRTHETPEGKRDVKRAKELLTMIIKETKDSAKKN